jgi:O-antigen ligase
MFVQIATLAFFAGILGLFVLNRDRTVTTSKALWIPVVWLWIAGSRPVSMWLADFGFANLVPTTSDAYVDGSPLDRAVFLGLMILGLIVLVRKGWKVGPLLRANGPLLLFFFYCAVSVSWSDYPQVAFKRWIKIIGDVVMVLIVVTENDVPAAVKRMFSRVGFLLIPSSILLIKFYGNLGREYRPDFGNWAQSYIGVATIKNLLGMITLICGVGALWCLLEELRRPKETRRTGPLIAQCTLLAMVVWLLAVVNSATSMSCFIIASLILVITSLRWVVRMPVFIHLLVIGVLSVSSFAVFFDTSGGLVGTVGRESTLTGRTDIWRLVLGMTANPLVGTGFESFWLGSRLEKMWSIYWWHPNEAHNGYLEVYLTLGWIGIALFAVFLIAGYRNIIAGFRRDPDIARLKLAFFVIVLIYNFTESAIRETNPIWIMLLLAIVAVPVVSFPVEVPYPRNFAERELRGAHPAPVGLRRENI